MNYIEKLALAECYWYYVYVQLKIHYSVTTDKLHFKKYILKSGLVDWSDF